MKIVTILGARPQFIKASVVSDKISEIENLTEVIIHTGQHFDKKMSNIFFDELAIPKPKYHLNTNQMNHGEMTGRMLSEIERILVVEEPDGVLVYGDTNSTLAGSLAAAKLNIPVFHVESGLRSFNRAMPEEINRIVTDHISSQLFCPTQNASNGLKVEGIKEGVIFSGDVMYDLFCKSNNLTKDFKNPIVLATIHRPANTDNPNALKAIINGLEEINKKIKVVFPVHPRTEKKIQEFGLQPKINMVSPLSYKEILHHLSFAEMVITDSGGLQKEAYFAKTKCITVRSETEWTELIDIGVNRLSAPSELYDAFESMRAKKCDFSPQLYGDGNAGRIIVDSIVEFISSGKC